MVFELAQSYTVDLDACTIQNQEQLRGFVREDSRVRRYIESVISSFNQTHGTSFTLDLLLELFESKKHLIKSDCRDYSKLPKLLEVLESNIDYEGSGLHFSHNPVYNNQLLSCLSDEFRTKLLRAITNGDISFIELNIKVLVCIVLQNAGFRIQQTEIKLQ